MKKTLSERHCFLQQEDKILNISSLANKAYKDGLNPLNGTVGMLFDENSNLVNFEEVDNIIAASNDANSKKYGGVTGGALFKKAICDWIIRSGNYDNVSTIATVGATGALFISMRNYTDEGQEILVPSIRWSTYDNIASLAGAKIKSYNLFKDGKLDIESIKENIDYSIGKYHRCYLLINDPCHNPTGYCLDYYEWVEIINYLKEKSKIAPIILMDDIAYMNYTKDDYTKIINLLINSVNDNLLVQFAFSAAKTLSIYGLRGGALITVGSNKDILSQFDKAAYATARSCWSMPNNMANQIIQKCFLDNDKRNNILQKINDYRLMLEKRAELFFSEIKGSTIKCKPYKDGFFVLVECKNNDIVCEQLIKRNIYVVPLAGGLRISLSSIPLNRIKELTKALKVLIGGENNERNN